eukprot:358605-Chlamydomonas_euryale.AAC.4
MALYRACGGWDGGEANAAGWMGRGVGGCAVFRQMRTMGASVAGWLQGKGGYLSGWWAAGWLNGRDTDTAGWPHAFMVRRHVGRHGRGAPLACGISPHTQPLPVPHAPPSSPPLPSLPPSRFVSPFPPFLLSSSPFPFRCSQPPHPPTHPHAHPPRTPTPTPARTTDSSSPD